MAMVNMNNLLNGKDSRWLQLEVCREFQRNKCSRPDTECKFAHPPANVEVQNGRVTACYDSIKGRCNREKPPCKYFHPPQHLKDQLLINGRNHLALKNALMQQMGLSPGQALVPGQVQAVAANPYLTGMPQVGSTYSPYFATGPIMPTIMGPDPTGVGSPLGVVPQTVVQQKMPRSDRLEPAAHSPLLAPPQASGTAASAALEIGKKRPRELSTSDTDLLLMDMKSVGSFYYENFAFPAGMVPYKRPAADKSGMPVYQPNATTYQQLMQLQQPFVPVSCEYSTSPVPAPTSSCASPTISETPAEPALGAPQQSLEDLPASIPQPPPQPHIPDPAALAKEVAQQNYAKAIKLAAVNQQYSALNPLNYTGVALNKQHLQAVQPQVAPFQRYPGLPFQFNAVNLGLANQYQAIAQQNLLNMGRPPPVQFNPYSIYRQQPYGQHTVASAMYANSTPIYGNSLLGAQYPVAVSTAQMSGNTAQASMAVAAAAQSNNNNVVLQPYKKLKTN